jgi:hypothetical protein
VGSEEIKTTHYPLPTIYYPLSSYAPSADIPSQLTIY